MRAEEFYFKGNKTAFPNVIAYYENLFDARLDPYKSLDDSVINLSETKQPSIEYVISKYFGKASKKRIATFLDNNKLHTNFFILGVVEDLWAVVLDYDLNTPITISEKTMSYLQPSGLKRDAIEITIDTNSNKVKDYTDYLKMSNCLKIGYYHVADIYSFSKDDVVYADDIFQCLDSALNKSFKTDFEVETCLSSAVLDAMCDELQRQANIVFKAFNLLDLNGYVTDKFSVRNLDVIFGRSFYTYDERYYKFLDLAEHQLYMHMDDIANLDDTGNDRYFLFSVEGEKVFKEALNFTQTEEFSGLYESMLEITDAYLQADCTSLYSWLSNFRKAYPTACKRRSEYSLDTSKPISQVLETSKGLLYATVKDRADGMDADPESKRQGDFIFSRLTKFFKDMSATSDIIYYFNKIKNDVIANGIRNRTVIDFTAIFTSRSTEAVHGIWLKKFSNSSFLEFTDSSERFIYGVNAAPEVSGGNDFAFFKPSKNNALVSLPDSDTMIGTGEQAFLRNISLNIAAYLENQDIRYCYDIGDCACSDIDSYRGLLTKLVMIVDGIRNSLHGLYVMDRELYKLHDTLSDLIACMFCMRREEREDREKVV